PAGDVVGEAVAVVVDVLGAVVALARPGRRDVHEVPHRLGRIAGVVAGEDLDEILGREQPGTAAGAACAEVRVVRRVDPRIRGVVVDVEDAVVIDVVAGRETRRGQLLVARRQGHAVAWRGATGDLRR